MRKLILLALFLLPLSPDSFSQKKNFLLMTYEVKDIRDHRPINHVHIYVKIRVKVNCGLGEEYYHITNEKSLSSVKINAPLYLYYEGCENEITWNSIISAAGFEDYVVNDKIVIYDFSKSVNRKQTIFLKPLKKEHDLYIANKDTLKFKLENTLEIFSAEEVAVVLKIELKDLLELITAGKIKANKIGERYFITKKRLHEYLEKQE